MAPRCSAIRNRPCKIHQHRANDGDMSEGEAQVGVEQAMAGARSRGDTVRVRQPSMRLEGLSVA